MAYARVSASHVHFVVSTGPGDGFAHGFHPSQMQHGAYRVAGKQRVPARRDRTHVALHKGDLAAASALAQTSFSAAVHQAVEHQHGIAGFSSATQVCAPI